MSDKNLSLEALIAGLEETSDLEKEAGEATDSVDVAAEEASPAAEALKETLTKEAGEEVASETSDEETVTSNEEAPEMNKQAQEKGSQLADAIIDSLTKKANEVKDKSEALAAEQDSETERTPEGTVNEVLAKVQERGKAKGAIDVGSQDAAAEAPAEGNDVGEDPVSADIEKAAAVSHLVSKEGHSFADAVELVKQAEADIEAERTEQIKVAAVNELMQRGVGIEDAVALVSAELKKA